MNPTLRPSAEIVRGWVENFFQNNYRDITFRKTLKWGEVQTNADGTMSMRYKYEARIWDKETITSNQIFTFTRDGKFVSVKKVE